MNKETHIKIIEHWERKYKEISKEERKALKHLAEVKRKKAEIDSNWEKAINKYGEFLNKN